MRAGICVVQFQRLIVSNSKVERSIQCVKDARAVLRKSKGTLLADLKENETIEKTLRLELLYETANGAANTQRRKRVTVP